MNSERRELVRGSDTPLVYSVQRSLYGRWFVAGADQASVKNTFGGWCVENWDKNSLSSPNGRKTEFWEDVTKDHRTTQATSHALGHGSRWTISDVTYTHVTLSGTKRSDHGLSLSRDRRSIVFGGQCWLRLDEKLKNWPVGPHDQKKSQKKVF